MSSSTVGPVVFRPATSADVPAEHAIFCRAEGSVQTSHGFDWHDPTLATFAPFLEHLLAHDPRRCFVAERDGVVVGFTAAIERGDLWFLSALFIDPEAQGHGIGSRLFELAFDGAPPRRMTLTDSIQPISNALYGRHGLLPTTPMLGFTGSRAAPAVDDRLTKVDDDPGEIAALDARVYGVDRAVDHRFMAGIAGRSLWARGDRVVACSYAWPNGRIGPILATDGAAAAGVYLHELAANPQGWIEVPGTSREIVAAALGAGAQLETPPGLLLLSGLAPPADMAISGYFLA